MDALILPTVNMNGTSKQELIDQQVAVAAAADALLTALRQASPHGRDYYMHAEGPGSLRSAREQHGALIQQVMMIQERALRIAEYVQVMDDGWKVLAEIEACADCWLFVAYRHKSNPKRPHLSAEIAQHQRLDDLRVLPNEMDALRFTAERCQCCGSTEFGGRYKMLVIDNTLEE